MHLDGVRHALDPARPARCRRRPALASDGVLEINQTCAVQTGYFAGDSAGLPVTISASGNYRLTSKLAAGANVDGIFVNTSRVTIDFNGFSLTGGTIGSGTGNGIAGGGADGAFAGFTTIRDGVIRGARALGIALGGAKGVRIENMTIEFNAGGGTEVGTEARVLNNTLSNNGGESTSNDGLVAGGGSLIDGNVVSGSGGIGISSLSPGSTVSGNTAYQNGTGGIRVTTGSTVSGNTSYQNGSYGFSAFSGSTIAGNTAYQNGTVGIFGGSSSGLTIVGNSVFDNGTTGFHDGISCGFGCLIRGNSIHGNVGRGLVLTGTCAYSDNVITDNEEGTVVGGVNAGGNVCNGSLACP